MPIDKIRKELYLFIRKREHTSLDNIRRYAHSKQIKPQDMGYALQQLKEKRAIFFRKKKGWFA